MPNSYDALGILGYDHLEFAVSDIESAARLYTSMGFQRVGVRELGERKLRSYLMMQNDILIILSQSSDPSDPIARYVAAHGDGVIDVALRCRDAVSALETAVKRGAEVAEEPRLYQTDAGSIQSASIKAFGDVRHSFITKKGGLIAAGFNGTLKQSPPGYGLMVIDHITTNVEAGKLDTWSSFYERIFGLENTRFFDIRTERTGLYSKVMQSPDRVVKMPVNEPTGSSSQIQEFIDVHHGPGVQHVALRTDGIAPTLRKLRSQEIDFLTVPSTYYEDIPKRVPNVQEDLGELEELGILVDGDEKGYLLQIFTQTVVGPFFYEVIQRKGNDGFGEGNFKALFEAIERDQIRRGVLKA